MKQEKNPMKRTNKIILQKAKKKKRKKTELVQKVRNLRLNDTEFEWCEVKQSKKYYKVPLHVKKKLQSCKEKHGKKKKKSKDYSNVLPHINAKYLYEIQTHNRFDILANCNEQVNNMHHLDYVKTKKGHKSNLNRSTNKRLAPRWQQKTYNKPTHDPADGSECSCWHKHYDIHMIDHPRFVCRNVCKYKLKPYNKKKTNKNTFPINKCRYTDWIVNIHNSKCKWVQKYYNTTMLRIHCKCTDKAEGIHVLHCIYALKISANTEPVARHPT